MKQNSQYMFEDGSEFGPVGVVLLLEGVICNAVQIS